MIKITLPDGAIKEYEKGSSALDVAKSISDGLARMVLAAKVNNEIVDPFKPLEEDARVELLTWKNDGGKSTFWHTSAHLLASALEELYPGVKLGTGPSIDNGFYYDVDFGEQDFSSNDFPKIEKKILELARQKFENERQEISKADALKFFTERGDKYKVELIEGLEDGNITLYKTGEFIDLCAGPHIPHTGVVKAVKLTNVAGAYWRNNENNTQMTRIYGITFPKKKELDEYLAMLEEAKKRDHRKLGKELELFHFSQKVGAGLPLWTPKGATLRERLENFLRKAQKKAGYQHVMTPHIGNVELYKTSGHFAKYGADSFQPIKTGTEGEEYFLKPMNCPHHCEIFNFKPHSYKELPIRFAEFGTVYRFEQSGELHGLTRVRGFTQDDAHIFCRPDQLKSEFLRVVDLVNYVYRNLGFSDFEAQISLRDRDDRSKYIGSDEVWESAEAAIIEATEEKGMKTVTEYGEAAFYGPKLDFMVKDALGRKWQLGTIQVDYNLPDRFKLEYMGSDNDKHRPVMIHRALFGSMERFIALLIENSAGNFPLWLAPEQVAILPISEKYTEYAEKIMAEMDTVDITGFVDNRDEKIGRKIRDSEVKKIPFMLIVGEKEQENGEISVRRHGEGDLGSMNLDKFIADFKKETDVEFAFEK
ncbi:MAG: threonyl-tRNA synthetase [Flammeovirgaceae bacterium]|jgi:threonyl-tRNA synthetase